VWWSRLARPALHAWQDDDHPRRLVAQTVARDDPAPQARACSGLLVRWWDDPRDPTRRSEELWLRFVAGRPVSAVSAVTSAFPRWCAAQAARRGTRAVLLGWDNASGHDAQSVRCGVRQHNRPVTQAGHGVRLIVSYLPVTSPWLTPIEPTWLPGKKRIVAPARLLLASSSPTRAPRASAPPLPARLNPLALPLPPSPLDGRRRPSLLPRL